MRPGQVKAWHTWDDSLKSDNVLMHHGIDGQKWGVKHGPPYPLDDSESTGSRLKIKKKKKRQVDPGLEEAIKRGGRFGLIGATVAAIKYDRKNKKSASEKYMERHKDEYEKQREEREAQHRSEMEKYKDPEFRKEKYNKAKNEDKWDYAFAELYFLNAKNRDESKDVSTEEALKEYKKYLQDPDKWIHS